MIEYNVITWMSGGYSWRREPAPTIAGTLIESTQKSVVLATGLLFKRYKFLLIRYCLSLRTSTFCFISLHSFEVSRRGFLRPDRVCTVQIMVSLRAVYGEAR